MGSIAQGTDNHRTLAIVSIQVLVYCPRGWPTNYRFTTLNVESWTR